MALDMTMALFRPALKYAMEKNGHGKALGHRMTRIERGEICLEFPYKEEVVGNPLTGVVHGGVIASLLDIACGSAAMTVLSTPAVAPTMDLRLDYMHPAEPRKPIYVEAKVYRKTSNVIFCRGLAWQDDKENPIAHCVANFMKVDSKSINFSAIAVTQLRRMLPWGKGAYSEEKTNGNGKSGQ